MPLPSNIQEQIEKDAKAYSSDRQQCLAGKKHLHVKTTAYHSYIAGATAYAEKAQKLVEALKEISKHSPDRSGFAKTCDQALADWEKEGMI